MPKIKLVAFDWNGTIISDARAAHSANSKTLEKLGYQPITFLQYQQHFQIPIRNFWISLGYKPDFFDKHAALFQKVFLEVYERLENKLRTRSGLRESLSWLRKSGVDAIVFSNHPEKHIDRQLKRFGLTQYFSTILGRPSLNSHMHARNKGEQLRLYSQRLKLKPTQVMTVGDTDEEIDIANQYGFLSVALTGGHQTTTRLRQSRPDYLIHNLKELKNIISKLNGRTTQRN